MSQLPAFTKFSCRLPPKAPDSPVTIFNLQDLQDSIARSLHDRISPLEETITSWELDCLLKQSGLLESLRSAETEVIINQNTV